MTAPATVRSSPLVRSVEVRVGPAAAFELFTARMGDWWPLRTHSVCEQDAASVSVTPGVGGRIVERSTTGDSHVWGTITSWEPGAELAFSWHPGTDPAQATAVRVRFTATADGTTVVLTHHGWDRRPDGAHARGGYDSGWSALLELFRHRAR